MQSYDTLFWLLALVALFLLAIALFIQRGVRQIRKLRIERNKRLDDHYFERQVEMMSSAQLEEVNKHISQNRTAAKLITLLLGMGASVQSAFAQAFERQPADPSGSQAGFIITIVLLLIPISIAMLLVIIRMKKVAALYKTESNIQKAKQFVEFLERRAGTGLEEKLQERKAAASYSIDSNRLSGNQAPHDEKGLLNIRDEAGLPFVAIKRKAAARQSVDPQLSSLVLWYILTAAFWLLFGTTIGQYIGIKFVAPDADHLSWLSFGRLRPVHTNAVFWGWASLGMLGLGYYIVPRVGNVRLYSYKLGWWTLYLINATVLCGSIALMAGLNNGGGEYREYIWPIMILFVVALVLTLFNYLKTIARRNTVEIYISNWYIVAAVMFGITIAVVAYWPTWQNGLGETIIQGYYMHQGVGMWFMMFTLGLVYYYLPQSLNKPIYSYSLGILAFWTQILFYTLIGSHHFVFSSIPWWLQTVAIFGSAGMAIPVIAGTTNFLMTFKNGWYKLADSYTLPFFLVGTIFYFTGSMQGTAEAFRSANLYWHFTDFTVAHSHLTMYGIISFFIWACIYTIIPRITQSEAPQITVGAHFWLAFLGLLFYTVPLMYGGTLRGLSWMEGKPFIESVTLMAPHWLWRAIGGSLMWISHLFFAYNLYKMLPQPKVVDVNEKAIELLKEKAMAPAITEV